MPLPARLEVRPELLYSQSMTHGVWPEAIVAGVGSTGSRLPAVLSWSKNETPFEMSSAEPPLASAAMRTPFSPACAVLGLPFSAIMPLYLGSSMSATFAGGATFLESQPHDMKPA